MEIMVGSNTLTGENGGRYYPVENFKMHDKYNKRRRLNDIGIIRVLGKINFNRKVQPIEMSPYVVPDNAEVQFTGFGKTRVG